MDDYRAEVKELQIGPTIRNLRQQQRLTLQDLSQATDLSKPLLSQIENDQVIPPLATLLRIAKRSTFRCRPFSKKKTTLKSALSSEPVTPTGCSAALLTAGHRNPIFIIRLRMEKSTNTWSLFWLSSIRTRPSNRFLSDTRVKSSSTSLKVKSNYSMGAKPISLKREIRSTGIQMNPTA